MFFTYLGRELRRRARQASLIAIGLALGIGLVITVTALSAGVKNAQGEVLHSLYGVGTDITVTSKPSVSTSRPQFGFHGAFGSRSRGKAGTKIDVDNLANVSLGKISTDSVTSIARMHNVAAAAGGLTLTDTKITGKIPSFGSSGSGSGSGGGFGGGGGGGGGSFHGFLTPTFITVSGVDLSEGALGPLSSGKLTSGATFTTGDASANDAVLSFQLRHPEQAQGRLDGHHRQDQLQGRRHRQRARRRQLLGRVHPARPGPGPGRAEGHGEHRLRGGDQRLRHHHGVEGDLIRHAQGHRDQLQ